MPTNLRTRIKLRYIPYDDLASVADRVLLKGEAAVVHVPSKASTVDGKTVYSAPTTLIKIGDGTTKFASLEWLSAKAADVQDWAKQDLNTFLSNDVQGYLNDHAVQIGTSNDKSTDYTFYGLQKYTDEQILDAVNGVEGQITNLINTYLEPAKEGESEAIDKLKEVTQWIVDNKEGAAKIIKDIEDINGFITTNTPKINANTEARHTHANKAELDSITTADMSALRGIPNMSTALSNISNVQLPALESFKDRVASWMFISTNHKPLPTGESVCEMAIGSSATASQNTRVIAIDGGDASSLWD